MYSDHILVKIEVIIIMNRSTCWHGYL